MNKNSGFAVLEAVLIFAIVSIIGGVGWYVKDSTSKSNNALSNAEQAQASYKSPIKKTSEKTSNAAAAKKSSSGTKTTQIKTSTKTPAVVHPTAADKEAAKYYLNATLSALEAYYATNGYYPSDIAESNFTDVCTGGCKTSAPPGTKFVYVPTPSGCKTANHNCMHFTLGAYTNSGAAILKLTSFY
jgi:type II secretory pathway pseudopilin PulG